MKKFNLVICQFFLWCLASAQPSTLVTKVTTQAEAIEKQLIDWRRHIHQHPELSNREIKTAEYVAAHLKKLGIEIQTGIAHTGVVGLLKTGKPGPVIAIRADMDALPVTERNSLPFASKVTTTFNDQEVGVMHACGHDVHTASLLGTARILHEIKNEFEGTVRLLFQPGEEKNPGGASYMIRDGALKNPTPTSRRDKHYSE